MPLLEAVLCLSEGVVLLLGIVVREVRVGCRPLCRGGCRGCRGRRGGGGGGRRRRRRLLLRKVHGYLNVPGLGLRVESGFRTGKEKERLERGEEAMLINLSNRR